MRDNLFTHLKSEQKLKAVILNAVKDLLFKRLQKQILRVVYPRAQRRTQNDIFFHYLGVK